MNESDKRKIELKLKEIMPQQGDQKPKKSPNFQFSIMQKQMIIFKDKVSRKQKSCNISPVKQRNTSQINNNNTITNNNTNQSLSTQNPNNTSMIRIKKIPNLDFQTPQKNNQSKGITLNSHKQQKQSQNKSKQMTLSQYQNIFQSPGILNHNYIQKQEAECSSSNKKRFKTENNTPYASNINSQVQLHTQQPGKSPKQKIVPSNFIINSPSSNGNTPQNVNSYIDQNQFFKDCIVDSSEKDKIVYDNEIYSKKFLHMKKVEQNELDINQKYSKSINQRNYFTVHNSTRKVVYKIQQSKISEICQKKFYEKQIEQEKKKSQKLHKEAQILKKKEQEKLKKQDELNQILTSFQQQQTLVQKQKEEQAKLDGYGMKIETNSDMSPRSSKNSQDSSASRTDHYENDDEIKSPRSHANSQFQSQNKSNKRKFKDSQDFIVSKDLNDQLIQKQLIRRQQTKKQTINKFQSVENRFQFQKRQTKNLQLRNSNIRPSSSNIDKPEDRRNTYQQQNLIENNNNKSKKNQVSHFASAQQIFLNKDRFPQSSTLNLQNNNNNSKNNNSNLNIDEELEKEKQSYLNLFSQSNAGYYHNINSNNQNSSDQKLSATQLSEQKTATLSSNHKLELSSANISKKEMALKKFEEMSKSNINSKKLMRQQSVQNINMSESQFQRQSKQKKMTILQAFNHHFGLTKDSNSMNKSLKRKSIIIQDSSQPTSLQFSKPSHENNSNGFRPNNSSGFKQQQQKQNQTERYLNSDAPKEEYKKLQRMIQEKEKMALIDSQQAYQQTGFSQILRKSNGNIELIPQSGQSPRAKKSFFQMILEREQSQKSKKSRNISLSNLNSQYSNNNSNNNSFTNATPRSQFSLSNLNLNFNNYGSESNIKSPDLLHKKSLGLQKLRKSIKKTINLQKGVKLFQQSVSFRTPQDTDNNERNKTQSEHHSKSNIKYSTYTPKSSVRQQYDQQVASYIKSQTPKNRIRNTSSSSLNQYQRQQQQQQFQNLRLKKSSFGQYVQSYQSQSQQQQNSQSSISRYSPIRSHNHINTSIESQNQQHQSQPSSPKDKGFKLSLQYVPQQQQQQQQQYQQNNSQSGSSQYIKISMNNIPQNYTQGSDDDHAQNAVQPRQSYKGFKGRRSVNRKNTKHKSIMPELTGALYDYKDLKDFYDKKYPEIRVKLGYELNSNANLQFYCQYETQEKIINSHLAVFDACFQNEPVCSIPDLKIIESKKCTNAVFINFKDLIQHLVRKADFERLQKNHNYLRQSHIIEMPVFFNHFCGYQQFLKLLIKIIDQMPKDMFPIQDIEEKIEMSKDLHLFFTYILQFNYPQAKKYVDQFQQKKLLTYIDYSIIKFFCWKVMSENQVSNTVIKIIMSHFENFRIYIFNQNMKIMASMGPKYGYIFLQSEGYKKLVKQGYKLEPTNLKQFFEDFVITILETRQYRPLFEKYKERIQMDKAFLEQVELVLVNNFPPNIENPQLLKREIQTKILVFKIKNHIEKGLDYYIQDRQETFLQLISRYYKQNMNISFSNNLQQSNGRILQQQVSVEEQDIFGSDKNYQYGMYTAYMLIYYMDEFSGYDQILLKRFLQTDEQQISKFLMKILLFFNKSQTIQTEHLDIQNLRECLQTALMIN